MNVPLQTLHVLRKDVRQGRWLFAGYVLLLVVAGLRAYTESDAIGPAVATTLIPLVGGLLVALAVQSDPPLRHGAHWVTLPLERGAVAASKLVLLAAVTALALAAHTLALMKFQLPAGDLLRMIAAALAAYLLLLTVAAAIAALTEDLRGFVLAVVAGLAIGSLLLALAGPEAALALATKGVSQGVFHLLAAGAAAMLIVLQYRRRIGRMGMLPAVAVCTVAGLVATLGADRAALPQSAYATEPGTGEAEHVPRLRAWLSPLPHGATGLTLEVVGGLPGYEYDLRQHVLHVQHDGRVESVSLGVNEPLALYSLRPDFPVTVPVPRGIARDLMVAPDVEVRLTGKLLVTRLDQVRSLPLATGSEAALPGYRIRIDSTALDEGLVEVGVETVYDEVWRVGNGSLDFAVRTPAGEVIPLATRSHGESVQPLLLGSTKFRQYRFELAPASGPLTLPDGVELTVHRRARVASHPFTISVPYREP